MVQKFLSELKMTPPEALEALVDTAPFLMHSADAQGRFLRMSPRWLDRLGYRPEDVIGRSTHGFLTPESAARARQVKMRLIRDGAVKDAELTFLSRKGASVPVNLNAIALYDDDGAFLRTVAISFDTSLHSSYREEVNARRAAERGKAAKSNLLAQIAHEVRTPMNIIMGYIQLARAGEIGTAEAGYLDTALSSAETLMTQMNDMLDLSRAEAGRLIAHIAPLDIAGQLSKLADQLGPRIKARGLDLKLELDPALPASACGDGVRILQILHNFMSNAIKFTEEGAITLRAAVLARTGPGWRVRIEVEDTGRGIDAADQADLFNSFSRGRDPGVAAVEGWGLGLSICKVVGDILGADLGVRSEIGAGACFYMELDLTENDGDATAPTPADAPPDMSPKCSRRVLVVEDNPRSRDLLNEALTGMGHEVDTAPDGLEAVERCLTRHYDVILMDMRMPRMRGEDAAARIRADGVNSRTPIIAVTADQSRGGEDDRLPEGIDCRLAKPLDLAAVRGVLERLETLRPA